MDEQSNNRDPFYVGYLPMPVEHRRFVRTLVVLLALWILGVAMVIAMVMRNPGDAVWNTGNEQSWTGTFTMHPYPMLIPDNDLQNPLLVVSIGKHGAHDRLAPFDRSVVKVRGWELHRDGRRLIELADDGDAITMISAVGERSPPRGVSRAVVVEGEIVDGKCYLGAMKPGDGQGHRSCAVLCLRGHLPPMIATTQPDGTTGYHLLVIDGTTELSDEVLAMVARPVRIAGMVAHDYEGLSVLYAKSEDITPSE